MRYILITIFILSLPAAALGSSVPNQTNDGAQEKIMSRKTQPYTPAKTKELLERIQKSTGDKTCDPDKILHMGPFN